MGKHGLKAWLSLKQKKETKTRIDQRPLFPMLECLGQAKRRKIERESSRQIKKEKRERKKEKNGNKKKREAISDFAKAIHVWLVVF